MYLVTEDERIIPIEYDQGSDLFVLKKRNHVEETDYVSLVIDEEEYEIVSVDIVDETRKVFFIDIEYHYDCDDDDCDEYEESDYEEELVESDSDSFPHTLGLDEESVEQSDDAESEVLSRPKYDGLF